MKFIQDNYKFLIAVLIIFVIAVWLAKRLGGKGSESSFYRDNLLFYPVDGLLNRSDRIGDLVYLNYKNMPCKDCGPGGMFGEGWTMEGFEKHADQMRQRARELSGGLNDQDLEKAVANAGGLIPYIKGRETAIRRMQSATDDLRGVMNIPGVHGIGTAFDHIEIAVLDDAAKQKVLQFIELKKRLKPLIPGHGPGYMNYPVKIVKREMAVAQ